MWCFTPQVSLFFETTRRDKQMLENVVLTSKKTRKKPLLDDRKIPQKEQITVHKAEVEDVEQIYRVACSVGTALKDPYKGFLIDDYLSDPDYYKEMFAKAAQELDHFYVAKKNDAVVGFLMAYPKEKLLEVDPLWLEEIVWDPDFDHESKTKNFALVGKTAIHANLTGKGIGSSLYARLIRDLKAQGIEDLFGETVISPTPNFASLAFRIKQKYSLAGIRYVNYKGRRVTDLIYHRHI
jgi:GNAT superfamily N-acetyltransferase